jgi:hypothetical protein
MRTLRGLPRLSWVDGHAWRQVSAQPSAARAREEPCPRFNTSAKRAVSQPQSNSFGRRTPGAARRRKSASSSAEALDFVVRDDMESPRTHGGQTNADTSRRRAWPSVRDRCNGRRCWRASSLNHPRSTTVRTSS